MEQNMCLMVAWLLCILAQYTGTKIIRVPLQVKSNADDNTALPAQAGRGHKMRGRVNEPLHFDLYNLQYYGSVTMGTPPQEIRVVFDTSTSYFSVLSSFCTDPECKNHKLYNHTDSSTFVPLPGKLSQDSVRIAGLTVQKQMFSENNVPPPDVTWAKFDGTVGMGRAGTDLVPLFYNMVKQGLVDQPVFAFYINSDEKMTTGSVLTLGGVDSAYYSGEIFYTPTTSNDTYWQIHVQSVKAMAEKGKNVCGSGGCKAYIDTRTSYIRAPNGLVDELNFQLGALPTSTPEGMWVFNCTDIETHPNVAITIGGKEFVMTPKHYILGQHDEVELDGDYSCVSAFAHMHISAFPSIADESTWTLGASFIGAFYTVLDVRNNQVGLAPTLK